MLFPYVPHNSLCKTDSPRIGRYMGQEQRNILILGFEHNMIAWIYLESYSTDSQINVKLDIHKVYSGSYRV